jgi:hypothetical protein
MLNVSQNEPVHHSFVHRQGGRELSGVRSHIRSSCQGDRCACHLVVRFHLSDRVHLHCRPLKRPRRSPAAMRHPVVLNHRMITALPPPGPAAVGELSYQRCSQTGRRIPWPLQHPTSQKGRISKPASPNSEPLCGPARLRGVLRALPHQPISVRRRTEQWPAESAHQAQLVEPAARTGKARFMV